MGEELTARFALIRDQSLALDGKSAALVVREGNPLPTGRFGEHLAQYSNLLQQVVE